MVKTQDDGRQRRRAMLRFALGMLQMFGAVVAVILLIQTGVSAATLWATGITTACSLMSRLLFRGSSP